MPMPFLSLSPENREDVLGIPHAHRVTATASTLANSSAASTASTASSVVRKRVLICRNPTTSLVDSSMGSATGTAPATALFQSFLANHFEMRGPQRYVDPTSSGGPSPPPLTSDSALTENDLRTPQQTRPQSTEVVVSSRATLVLHDNSSTDNENAEQHEVAVSVDPFPSEYDVARPKSTRNHRPCASGSGTAAGDQDPELCELAASAKYLKNWVPRIKGDKMYVEGDLLDFDNPDPNHIVGRWKTTSVVERRRANVVMTRKMPYVLEGKLNFGHARKGEVPTFIIMAFKDGFPEKWETYREEWMSFMQEQASNDDAMSTISSLASQLIERPNSKSKPINSGAPNAELVCQECGKQYKMTMWYQNHIKWKHGIKLPAQPPTDGKKLRKSVAELVCQECGKMYKMSMWYHNHLRSKHRIHLDTQSQRDGNSPQDTMTRRKGESETEPPRNEKSAKDKSSASSYSRTPMSERQQLAMIRQMEREGAAAAAAGNPGSGGNGGKGKTEEGSRSPVKGILKRKSATEIGLEEPIS